MTCSCQPSRVGGVHGWEFNGIGQAVCCFSWMCVLGRVGFTSKRLSQNVRYLAPLVNDIGSQATNERRPVSQEASKPIVAILSTEHLDKDTSISYIYVH